VNTILGLDPGNEVGFAIINVDGSTLDVVDYGTIPTLQPGIGGMLWSVLKWLEINATDAEQQLVFEEFICSHRIPSSKESHEVRGVIRLFCYMHKHGNWQAIVPATIRSQLSVKNKKEVRQWVESALGFKPGGKDHVPDAFAVAMAYAIKNGLWRPLISYRQEVSKPSSRKVNVARKSNIDPDNLTLADIQAGLISGEIGIGKRG
jgi:Holliday junction resolvasome RuvABC endonuclease subunit